MIVTVGQMDKREKGEVKFRFQPEQSYKATLHRMTCKLQVVELDWRTGCEVGEQ
jgi:hypothetical protein